MDKDHMHVYTRISVCDLTFKSTAWESDLNSGCSFPTFSMPFCFCFGFFSHLF